MPEPVLDVLSNIIKSFNDQFGTSWTDNDRVYRLISQDIPRQVAADTAYQNAQKNSDEANARIEYERALGRVMNGVIKDDMELFKRFSVALSWQELSVIGRAYQTEDAQDDDGDEK